MRCRMLPALAVALSSIALTLAQDVGAQGAGPQPQPSPASSAPTATDASGSTRAAAPAASDAPPAKPVVPATGYGWSTHPTHGAPTAHHRVHATAGGPPTGTVVPGFETLADGSSRVFVQMPRPTTYTTRATAGSITYVLKGVRIDRRNNLNALVTVHFNTPVTSARLVPHGGDLWFVLDLRSSVTPTVAMDATKDGGAMLRVEFPKGDYLSQPQTARAAR